MVTAKAETINTSSFEEGSGRITCVAGALEYEGAFLSPLLASEVSKCRYFDFAVELRDNMRAIRVDAQASGLRTGIGGWFPNVDTSGVPTPARSKWFAPEITKVDFQWIYDRGDTPSRVISTLEALGVLLALKLKHGEQPQGHRSRVTVTLTIIDNRGNGAALNKQMSSQYPASVILI